MTARQVFEYALIEINKVQAPSLLLEDYNYFINKAITQYCDKRYNIYDVNQQTTDDLRVLKGTAILSNPILRPGSSALHGATYSVTLPDDYFHLLNCVVEYLPSANYKCYKTGVPFFTGAKRLTADMFSQIINNYYMRPTYKNPYYYLHNDIEPTVTSSPDIVDERDGNSSPVRLEVRYGRDNTLFVLKTVYVDYLKTPRTIVLTQDQLDKDLDTSQELEFPDYICFEIIKELVALLMENASDPRLQSNPVINQAIPQQGPQQEEVRGRSR